MTCRRRPGWREPRPRSQRARRQSACRPRAGARPVAAPEPSPATPPRLRRPRRHRCGRQPSHPSPGRTHPLPAGRLRPRGLSNRWWLTGGAISGRDCTSCVALLLLAIAAAIVFFTEAGAKRVGVVVGTSGGTRRRGREGAGREPGGGILTECCSPVMAKEPSSVADPGDGTGCPRRRRTRCPSCPHCRRPWERRAAGPCTSIPSMTPTARKPTSRVSASAGFPSFSRPAQVEGVTWQRVYVGPYSSRDEAQAVAARVSAAGLSTYVQVVKIGNGDQ